MAQPGFFDLYNSYKLINRPGDHGSYGSVHSSEKFRPLGSKALYKFKKSNAGHKPYDSIFMFKILVLQSLNKLSDVQTKFQIKDRLSFMPFLGLDFEDRVPDAKTLLLFRDMLSNKNTIIKLFRRFNRHLNHEDLFVLQG
jgi:IS5 family transposase